MTLWIQALLLIPAFLCSLQVLAQESQLAEAQVSLCETSLATTLEALDLSSEAEKDRQTGFFETPDLFLSQHDFFIRVRRTDKKATLAFKRNNPSSETWRDPRFKCETDYKRQQQKQACTYEIDFSPRQFSQLRENPSLLWNFLNREQRDIFLQLGGGFQDFKKLVFLGEVPSYKWSFPLRGNEVVLDVWIMPPTNEALMELSIRGPLKDAPDNEELLRLFLDDRGLTACEPTQGRTQKVLRYFVEKI